MRRSSHVFLHRQVAWEGIHLRLGQLPWMQPAVEADVAADPVNVRLLGTPAGMPYPQNLHHAVIEPGRGPVGKQPNGFVLWLAVDIRQPLTRPNGSFPRDPSRFVPGVQVPGQGGKEGTQPASAADP